MNTITPHNKFTPGRFLQALAIAKGDAGGASAYAESQNWNDRSQIVGALKAAVTSMGTADYAGAYVPIQDAFLAAMRSYSIPAQLVLRRVPMLTRLYVNAAGIVAARVAEGAAIPVFAGDWNTHTLTPVKHAGIVIQTDELIKSADPTAAAAITDDLAQAVAESENRSFLNPDETTSVLYGASHFSGTGSGVANVDADLLNLFSRVPGVFKPGAAIVMTTESATYLSLLRWSGGARAYPDITPQGGTLQGLPVLISSACAVDGSPSTRIIGLVSASEVFYSEGGIELMTSSRASLQQLDNPTTSATTPTATNMISLFQAGSTALRGIKSSSWYARTGSAAYFVAGF